jgi:hypothetical protein
VKVEVKAEEKEEEKVEERDLGLIKSTEIKVN